MSSSAHPTGSYCSTSRPKNPAYWVMAAAVSRSSRSAAHRKAVRRLAQFGGEPLVGLALSRTVPQGEHISFQVRRSKAHEQYVCRSACPPTTSCSSANCRMVSSIENRVRPDDRSATRRDLRTRASRRSSVANSSSESTTAQRGRQVEAAGENRATVEQRLLVLIQQVVGPLHRVAQRLMALQPTPRPDQQPEPVVEAIADLGHRHRHHPRCGQLDSQRNSVKASADLHHRNRIQRDTGHDGFGALDEEGRGSGVGFGPRVQ